MQEHFTKVSFYRCCHRLSALLSTLKDENTRFSSILGFGNPKFEEHFDLRPELHKHKEHKAYKASDQKEG